MSKFCLAEIATLLIGWISNCLFLLYSEGMFTDSRTWVAMDMTLLNHAAFLALPYVLTFVCCWVSHRFVKAFLLLSLFLTIGSTCAYYGLYITDEPAIDAGWIFILVPLTQTAVAVTFSLMVFLLSLLVKPKPVAA